MSADNPTGEVPRGCAIRIIAVFMITALSLAWYAMSVEKRSASELERCVKEAAFSAQESARRATTIEETLDTLSAGRMEAPVALQRYEDLRASSTSMTTVLRKSTEAGRCSTEGRPVLALLAAEEKARSSAAESASELIRAEQALRESKRLSSEAADYRERYSSLGQKHLLTLAKDFKARADKAGRSAQALKRAADQRQKAMRSALNEHRRLLRAII